LSVFYLQKEDNHSFIINTDIRIEWEDITYCYIFLFLIVKKNIFDIIIYSRVIRYGK
jgi:hypothetical protein